MFIKIHKPSCHLLSFFFPIHTHSHTYKRHKNKKTHTHTYTHTGDVQTHTLTHIQEAYKHTLQTSEYHKRLTFSSGDSITIHNPDTIIYHPPEQLNWAFNLAVCSFMRFVVVIFFYIKFFCNIFLFTRES